ncbi:hypothetical protein NKH77_03400 [Streptomyces sp. M19]
MPSGRTGSSPSPGTNSTPRRRSIRSAQSRPGCAVPTRSSSRSPGPAWRSGASGPVPRDSSGSGAGPGEGGGAEFFRLLTLAVRAYLMLSQGEYARAAEAADRLRAECEQRGEVWMRAWGVLPRPGRAGPRGRRGRRPARPRRAGVKWRLRDGLGVAAAVDLLTGAAVADGDMDRAARLLGAGTRQWDLAGLAQLGMRELTFRRTAEGTLRATLGDGAFEAAYQAGRELGRDEGIGLALNG